MSKFIILERAVTMRNLYKESKEVILADGISKDILPQAELFDKQHVLDLLNQNNCAGMRAYYSMDESQNFHLLLVGVDSEGENIIDSNEPLILDEAERCPPICPTDSELG